VYFITGSTEEYSEMIDRVHEINPDTICIAVGFSMGGNIITKYLGESQENQEKVMCGISCGQGYDAER
jgi:abhydrolase domain-containing protein 2